MRVRVRVRVSAGVEVRVRVSVRVRVKVRVRVRVWQCLYHAGEGALSPGSTAPRSYPNVRLRV